MEPSVTRLHAVGAPDAVGRAGEPTAATTPALACGRESDGAGRSARAAINTVDSCGTINLEPGFSLDVVLMCWLASARSERFTRRVRATDATVSPGLTVYQRRFARVACRGVLELCPDDVTGAGRHLQFMRFIANGRRPAPEFRIERLNRVDSRVNPLGHESNVGGAGQRDTLDLAFVFGFRFEAGRCGCRQ